MICTTTFTYTKNWLFLTRDKERYLLANDEISCIRQGRNELATTEVTFLVATERPLFDKNGDVLFGGKIGLWPFVENVPAKRSSKNRKKACWN